MSRFRVLVADDEPLGRQIIVGLLSQDRDVDDIIECSDGTRARDLILNHQPDIAFLDIEMPGVNGLDIARDLSDDGPVVVFTTAFARYALDAFAIDAVDYILKPFSDERFFQALNRSKRKVRERYLGRLASQMAALATEIMQTPETHRDRLASHAPRNYLHHVSLKDGSKVVAVKMEDILWIEAEDYYAMVHSTTGGRLVRISLAALEERLDPAMFMRVHRSAIVNLEHVREVKDNDHLTIVLSDGTEVGVSRARRQQVQHALQAHVR